jgi:DNA-binding transcriptional MerR regulator
MDLAARVFRTTDVARIAEVSLRQLQLWEERRVVIASRQGRVRVYDTTQTMFVVLAAELRRRGMSFQKLRRLSGSLLEFLIEHRLAEISGQRQVFLLTDGRHVQFADSPNKTCELVSNFFQPVVCINLSDCLQKIHKAEVSER